MTIDLATPGDAATVDAYVYFSGGTSVYPEGMVLIDAIGDVATVEGTATADISPVFDAIGDMATVDATIRAIAGAPTEADAIGDTATADAIVTIITAFPRTFVAIGDSATVDATVKTTGGIDAIDEYDFTDPVVKQALADPGIISINLGTIYADESFEEIPITRQFFTKSTISDDDLSTTFEGESFITRLDQTPFYGGRYDPAGIPASTLFAEIIEDVEFPEEGEWNYRLEDPNCRVSNTQPLWTRSGYEYYRIDPALDSIRVFIPIPVVSHREALTMLAAYCGAYLIHRSDGALDIRASLDERLDYHFDLGRVYDRPEMINGTSIARIQGTIQTYQVADTPEVILETDISVVDLNSDTFTLTHDPCAEGVLTLTNATLIETPIYNTYSTTFDAAPLATTFHVVLTGKRVTISESQFGVDYPNTRGEAVEFSCPIASDLTLTKAMYDRYYKYSTALGYRFSMRDDPAVEVGDRLYLDTLSEPEGIPVLVKEIRRTFNGGVDAEYTVIEDL